MQIENVLPTLMQYVAEWLLPKVIRAILSFLQVKPWFLRFKDSTEETENNESFCYSLHHIPHRIVARGMQPGSNTSARYT